MKAVEKMKAHEKVIFTPTLIMQFWLQREHCEKAQSYNSFRKLTDERGSETELLSSLLLTAHTSSHDNTYHTLQTSTKSLLYYWLVVKYFLENAAIYMSVVDFVEALEMWVDDALLHYIPANFVALPSFNDTRYMYKPSVTAGFNRLCAIDENSRHVRTIR